MITFFVITTEIMYTYATQGFGYGFSSNRPAVEKSDFGKRVERTYKNQIESAAYIVPVLAAGAFLNFDNPGASLATLLIILGRIAFVILYYTGIPFIRILGFSTASFATLYLAVVMLMHSF